MLIEKHLWLFIDLFSSSLAADLHYSNAAAVVASLILRATPFFLYIQNCKNVFFSNF